MTVITPAPTQAIGTSSFAAAAPLGTTVIVAAGANLRGVAVRSGVLIGGAGGVTYLSTNAGAKNVQSSVVNGPVNISPVLFPPGAALEVSSAGAAGTAYVNYEVL